MMTNVLNCLMTTLAQASDVSEPIQKAVAAAADGGTSLWLGQMGAALALGLAAVGSALGIGVAGRAAAGAWAKEAKAGIGMRFTYIILLGMPISQTLYAMIVMKRIAGVLLDVKTMAVRPDVTVAYAGLLLAVGLGTGIAEMFSAWMQGQIGAAGIRGLNESEGKGFAFIIIAMGVVESVGIFAMVFMLGLLPSLGS